MEAFPSFRILALGGLLACAGCATVGRNNGVAYKVDIDGAGWSLGRTIKESTALCKLEKQPPATVGQLRHRMEKDREAIEAILESNGYYDATVHLYLDESRNPARVEIKVQRGEEYRFGRVHVQYEGTRNEALERIEPRIRKGQHVVARNVLDEEKRILDQLKRCGYPFPRLLRRTIEVDREMQLVDLDLLFDAGVPARFGEVRVEGLETLGDKYIRRQLPWREGDAYNAKDVETLERKLLTSGLFSSVHAGPDSSAGDTNSIPILIRATERDKRTIRLGVNYSDVGPGVKGYWEHRSLFGGGERLETSLAWDPVKTIGTARFTRTGFLDSNQYLVLDTDAVQETPEAYDARHITGKAMVLRDLTPILQAGIGIGYKYSLVEQLNESERYAHVFFPLQAVLDTRNDRLNPVSGMQLFGRTSFFNDTLGSESFLKTEVEGRHYAMLWEQYRLSSALRLTLGSIDGASINSVPADERYYAGGGGSIRGYEYQQVGPKVNGVPTGGDSLVEFSAELRLRPGRKLGYAAFLDGGTVYNEQFGDFNRSLRYGAGLGIRWFTVVGPLRADFAYPLNPSEGQVERLQFYISLGQAF